MKMKKHLFSALLGLQCIALPCCAANSGFNIRDYGAVGDGITLDTIAIQKALDAAAVSGGQVYLPSGRYLSGTIQLRSGVTFYLEAGARLIGTTNLNEYRTPQSRQGKWQRALIIADNADDFQVMGQGTIDGNKVFDPTGEEHKRGPHAFNMVNCRKFTLRDFSIVDHANYAIFFQECDNVEIRNVKISNGWDGVHFRGQPGHWCHNVNIIGCHFYTGDDCIAGDYWDRTVISDCIINSVCNGIRLIGPATHLIINNCLFYGPSTQPREQGRRNMLSGILLQPGAWSKTQGVVDDVFLADNTMHNVASPVTIWNNLGNTIGHITVSGLDASGIDKAAFSAESWTEAPITNLVLQNIHAEFNGGGEASQAQQAVKKPGFDVRSLPAWGLYARNVHELTIEDVRMSFATDDFRPVVVADGVEKLRIENFRYPSLPGVPISIFTTNVSQFIMNGTNVHQ